MFSAKFSHADAHQKTVIAANVQNGFANTASNQKEYAVTIYANSVMATMNNVAIVLMDLIPITMERPSCVKITPNAIVMRIRCFVNFIQKNAVIVAIITVLIAWKSVLVPVVVNIVDFVRKKAKYVIPANAIFAIAATLFSKNVSMNHVW